MNRHRHSTVVEPFADRLTALIRALHLKPAGFIRLTGLHRSTVYAWLNGARTPDVDNRDLDTIVETTKVRRDWLTDASGNMFDGEA